MPRGGRREGAGRPRGVKDGQGNGATVLRTARERSDRLVAVLDAGIDRAELVIREGDDRAAMSALRAVAALAVVAMERTERREQLAEASAMGDAPPTGAALVRERLAAIAARQQQAQAAAETGPAAPWADQEPRPGRSASLQLTQGISAVDNVDPVDIVGGGRDLTPGPVQDRVPQVAERVRLDRDPAVTVVDARPVPDPPEELPLGVVRTTRQAGSWDQMLRVTTETRRSRAR